MKILLLVALLLSGIMPAPRQCVEKDGTYNLQRKEYRLSVSGQDRQEVADFRNYLSEAGYTEVKGNAGLVFKVGKFKSGKPYGATVQEGYALDITQKGISVKAASLAGAFYAFQTLRQLDNNGSYECCSIADEPAMSHRGLMFDVVRHFRSVDFVCRQLDAMASLKMNRLHFHLTDDQAFRLKLDSHPELVKSAFRKNIRLLAPGSTSGEYAAEPDAYVPGTVNFKEGCYGGYYTKENIRQILEYARVRHIEVIPEIEMPGHSLATLNIHPELRCNCDGKVKNVVCPGKEETFAFLEEVLAEVIELFPGRYIHIGGDEAKKDNWKICPDCARRMKKEGLTTVEQLQSYLTGRIERFVNSKGKAIIGWDEIMQGGLCPNATVMSWRGTKHGKEAAAQGHDVIYCPESYCYLDYYQGHPSCEPVSIGGNTPLSRTWSVPVQAGDQILGIQGNLWCEFITSDRHFEYMLYPRAFAIAETGWSSQENRSNFEEFTSRVSNFSERLRSRGYSVRDITKDSISTTEPPVRHLAYGAAVDFKGGNSGKKRSLGKLTDGKSGGTNVWADWERITGRGEFTVDLGSTKDIHYIGTSCLNNRKNFLPEYIEVSVSEDGKEYRTIGRKYSTAFLSIPAAKLSSPDFDPSACNPAYDAAAANQWSTAAYPFVCNERGIRFVRFVFVPRRSDWTTAVDELTVN